MGKCDPSAPLGHFIACAFFVSMMPGELSHFVLPFLEYGTFHYAAGMYTAVLPAASGGFALYRLRNEVRRAASR